MDRVASQNALILTGSTSFGFPAAGFGRRGFLGKMADYASFYVSLLTALSFQRERPDVILSLTTPPYIGLLGRFAARRHRCRHSHWIMDLYPDVMFAHGMARSGLGFRFLQALTRVQLRGADSILARGPMMAKRVAAYQTSEDRPRKSVARGPSVRWFPLWTKPELARGRTANPTRCGRSAGGLRTKWFSFIPATWAWGIASVNSSSRQRAWAPQGQGGSFRAGEKDAPSSKPSATLHPAARIEFLDYVPPSQLRAHMCAADITFREPGFRVAGVDGSQQASRPVSPWAAPCSSSVAATTKPPSGSNNPAAVGSSMRTTRAVCSTRSVRPWWPRSAKGAAKPPSNSPAPTFKCLISAPKSNTFWRPGRPFYRRQRREQRRETRAIYFAMSDNNVLTTLLVSNGAPRAIFVL